LIKLLPETGYHLLQEDILNTHLLVLDFDGTLTDAEVEGQPYRQGYLEDLSTLSGAPLEEIHRIASVIEAEVVSCPNKHGWIYQGDIVAPAMVDPYLRMMPIAEGVFEHYNLFRNPEERHRIEGLLYKYNYQKTTNAFRSGTRELLLQLKASNTYIVTNSHTDPVRSKIGELEKESGELAWLQERVFGRAKKYMIDRTLNELPTSIQLDGLERPVLLQRGYYYGVLKRLLDESGLNFTQLVVIGDIFELDLALPLALGAKVGLMVNPFTPKYEINYLNKHERGYLIHHIDEILALLTT
jgi:FMN phosphatase YigB (HAD superfamily)